MIRNLTLICSAVLAGIISLYAFDTQQTRADLTYVNPSGIHTLDPARMSWTQDFRVALNVWEGLTTWHPKTVEPIEGAAHFPPRVSADGRLYTFTLREDACWSNGDPVNAADFVRGWRRGLEPGTATDYAFLFTDHVEGAADYVKWRQAGVSVLTALDRLREGWGIDAEQAKVLTEPAVFARIRAADGNASEPGPWLGTATDDAWARWFSNADINWASLHGLLFDEHAAGLEPRWAKVGIRAADERTLVVRLVRPCPYFLDLTGFPTLLPCHESVERLRESYRESPLTAQGLVVYDPQWTKPDYHRNGYPGLVTNGPYRLLDWTFKRRARLVVNPYHRAADTIACRTVDMLVYENVSAAIMAYEANRVDFLPAMDVPYDHEIARLGQSGERPDFHLCVVLATYFFNFNCTSREVGGMPNPLLDRRVRRALTLATDKRAIVEQVLKRGDRVASSFVPRGAIPGYEPPFAPARDVAAAVRLLADAGYPGGAGLPPIELLYVPSDERVCQALARMWEESLGVRVALRCKESKTFAEDKANHRFMVARANWYADYNDPTTFLDCLATGNGNNDSGYSNARYDELLSEAARTPDRVERAEILRRAEAIIVAEDFPILPMLHYATPIAIKPYVKGLYPNARLWFPFRYVTIER